MIVIACIIGGLKHDIHLREKRETSIKLEEFPRLEDTGKQRWEKQWWTSLVTKVQVKSNYPRCASVIFEPLSLVSDLWPKTSLDFSLVVCVNLVFNISWVFFFDLCIINKCVALSPCIWGFLVAFCCYNLIPLWFESRWDDFYSFKLVKVCFKAQNVACLGECSM